MKIERKYVARDGFRVPCIFLVPPGADSAAVVIHGYGGCKEEPLGLAWRIAESGVAACTLDLRGHGEHEMPLDEHLNDDLEAVIDHCRNFGRITAIGHSLGGRLALISSADHSIGISPAYLKEYSTQTYETIRNARDYRTRSKYPGQIFDILRDLPVWQPKPGKEDMVIYGSRDIPEIRAACEGVRDQMQVLVVEKALHNDIFMLEATYGAIIKQLSDWR